MEEEAPSSSNPTKTDQDFLFPKMPGPFRPVQIRKKSVEWLRDRYLQVMSATMGNHSTALFYCCWTQEQFDNAMDDEFASRIVRVKSELADRATLIMLRGVGLVDGGDSGKIAPTVTAVMAKVVEGLREKGEKEGPKRGFRLVVDGLDRTAQAPAKPNPAPQTEDF